MSSPNACGCISLLLSGCKATGLTPTTLYPSAYVSPHRIRHALNNSCTLLPEVNALGQGHGLIQVASAWEYYQRTSTISELDYHLDVSVLSHAMSRGIYLRHLSEVSQRETYKVEVKPIFPKTASSDIRLNFEWKLKLSCDSPWVKCPEFLILAQSGKTFSVEIDPRGLSEGMHVACVRGALADNPDAGFVLEVPITVLKPQVVEGYRATQPASAQGLDPDNTLSLGTISLRQGERNRKFLVPPVGCTFMDAIISDARHAPNEAGEEGESSEGLQEGSPDGQGDSSARMLVLHMVQLMKGSAYSKHEKQVYCNTFYKVIKHLFGYMRLLKYVSKRFTSI